jgi:hypothetical protein
MTTQTALRAEIADDLNRDDITTQIAAAITAAIEHYKTQRFFFNETRGSTFATVDGQSRYTSSDDADIPLFFQLDEVFVNDGTQEEELEHYGPAEMEFLLGHSSPPEGVPYAYAYYDRSFWLYPVPDDAYTVRPLGAIEKAAPATDGEADNVWMVECYEAIRCRAKAYLAIHVLRDTDLAVMMRAAENEALQKLRSETGKRVSSGCIRATAF